MLNFKSGLMHRSAVSLILLAALCGTAAGQEIVFSKPGSEPNHVNIQPEGEFHLVYFAARFKGYQGQRVYARMMYGKESVDSTSAEAVLTRKVQVEANDETWQFFFRVPKFQNGSKTYRIELGSYIPDRPDRAQDGYSSRLGFVYTIKRDIQGNASFSPQLGQVRQEVMLPIRVVVATGGGFEVFSEARVVEVNLRYDITNRNVKPFGESMARKISR